MDPVTRDKLAGNAFRTLGLSASAGQSEIVAAARQMRIWPDASRIPPTPWDTPWLGPLRRSKPDIEQAVTFLTQPITRLEHRLLWYGTAAPPAESSADSADIAARHASVMLGLQRAVVADASGRIVDWPMVVKDVAAISCSPDLAERLRDVEARGRFDKLTSAEDQAEALALLSKSVAAGLVSRAVPLFEKKGATAALELVTAVRGVPNSVDIVAALIDRFEDLFDKRCAAVDAELRDKLRTNHSNPVPYYRANHLHAQRGAAALQGWVHSVFQVVTQSAGDDKDRLVRINVRLAELLTLQALAWEWAGRFNKAMQTLQDASNVARDTVAEYQVRHEMDRVAAIIAERRKPLNRLRRIGKAMIPQRASRRQTHFGWGIYLAVVALSAVMRFLSSSSSQENKSAPSPSRMPASIYKPAPDPFPDPARLPDPSKTPRPNSPYKVKDAFHER